ncbi:MAG TPA: hypothetical protein VF006_31705 [Longimicrobium sp.]
MDPFLFCLILGFAGLVIMAASGVASHGHDAGGHDAGAKEIGGHGGKDLGHHHGHDVHVKDVGHGLHVKDLGDHDADAGRLHDTHDGHADGFGDDVGHYLLSLLSPRVAFSILTGVGAAGLLLEPVLGGVLLLAAALVAGFAFEGLLVRPFWNFFFRFASNPAQTLESALMDRATAVTGFDAQGQGVVSIILDGQIVQLLGTLRPEDRATGVRVRAGDALTVEDVDGKRNRCVVSWQGSGVR